MALQPIDGKAKDKQGADSLSVPRKAKEMHGRSGQYGETQRHRYAGKETAWSGEEQQRFAQQRIGTDWFSNELPRKV